MDINATNINNTLYLEFRNVYPCWLFIISAGAINLVALFGMVTNFGVIWVTYRTKTLHGTANFLIALCSLFDLLHQLGHVLFLYTALSGRNFVPLSTALHFCTPSLFGLGAIALSIAFTGLDRLLCVLFPAFPRTVKPLPYLCGVTALCLASSIFYLFVYYKGASERPNLMVTGTIGELIQDPLILMYSLILYSITIVLYCITGIVIKRREKKSSSSAELSNRRIFRSLLFIILLNIGGSYVNIAFLLFLLPLLEKGNPILAWSIKMLMGILTVNVSSASNGPVLYMTSKEYRNGFQREFFKIRHFFFPNWTSPVLPISVVPMPTRRAIGQTQHQNRMQIRRSIA